MDEIDILERDHAEEIKRFDVRGRKKNYSQNLSNKIAISIADHLRTTFPGILPKATGEGTEWPGLGESGEKKLDVAFSTTKQGTALGISIKTINFKDAGSRRYTKNVKRNDGELRAEAGDYHRRQPFMVLAAFLFLPRDAMADRKSTISSFDHAVDVLRKRTGRKKTDDRQELFEKIFVAVYDRTRQEDGQVSLFDVEDCPGKGREVPTITFCDCLSRICDVYDTRNPLPLKRHFQR